MIKHSMAVALIFFVQVPSLTEDIFRVEEYREHAQRSPLGKEFAVTGKKIEVNAARTEIVTTFRYAQKLSLKKIEHEVVSVPPGNPYTELSYLAIHGEDACVFFLKTPEGDGVKSRYFVNNVILDESAAEDVFLSIHPACAMYAFRENFLSEFFLEPGFEVTDQELVERDGAQSHFAGSFFLVFLRSSCCC